MQISSLPVLIFIIFGFLTFLIRRLHILGQLNSSERNALAMLLIVVLVWGGCSGYLSNEGVYDSISFLKLAPGYWLPYIPVVITVTLMMLSTQLRLGLRKFVDFVPAYWLTGIHMLRILAIGSIFKSSIGVFPEKFAWYMGIPDLLFGLSAIPITLLVKQKRLSNNFIMFWHITGALVIMVPALSLMHIFMEEALFPELFAFPMALAPTLVVPMFVMLNLMVVWRLLEKKITAKV